jgi:hypothetical protein
MIRIWTKRLVVLLVAVALTGTTFAPGTAPAVRAAAGLTVDGIAQDADNTLNGCGASSAPFGQDGFDFFRCFTFRYQVPPGGITSATLHLAIKTLEPSTDGAAIGVNQATPNCDWGRGSMPGCVPVYGWPVGGVPTVDVNLFDVTSNTVLNNSPATQQALIAQLNTGVVHGFLQDDSILYCAQLVLNGGSGVPLCTSDNPTTGGTVQGGVTGDRLGTRWDECEGWCGTWLRQGASDTWSGSWDNGATATLAITLEGDTVTVQRSDPNGLRATYVGTIATDGVHVSGTVTWCCDGLGTRSGTWTATIVTSIT